MISFAGIMHHKFCVIDKRICMFGSFNWTESANIRNIEDLNMCEFNVVGKYLLEFNALWNLSKNDLRLLTKPDCCSNCRSPIINILLMAQESYDQTKIDVLQQCECTQKIVYTDYYDASVYNNYLGTIQQFDDDIIAVEQSGDEIAYQQLIA